MRGEMLHYDEAQGFGFIEGADGNRYGFTREDLRQAMAVGKGTEVEFTPSGGQARDVFPIHAPVARSAGPMPQPGRSVPQFGRRGVADSQPAPAQAVPRAPRYEPAYSDAAYGEPSTGLWSYFWRAITTNYVNFSGRARRKEYWAFTLFMILGGVVLGALIGIFAAVSGQDEQSLPIMVLFLLSAFGLAMVLPSIAVTVRRIHDLGLSGWFYLLIFVPFGGFVLLVFTLLPSQKHDNKWGPVPEGVSVPALYIPDA
ncbi:DUF805 domain-containing protein [Hoeflea sp. 108]|jgi:uncharacterized membrane protein YhaH (DUF805 family)/cold shock CspA family protein|uniref:DUF805 domain-containing protein n=1 Tax=Hoeflea sp. 108 TaxID=1116369 RepID=UPI0003A7D1A2|nr:DUF805 domain-containing protein [Hoeflea sp. 108]